MKGIRAIRAIRGSNLRRPRAGWEIAEREMSVHNEQTVLVTGASSGIGLELARCFAADGCRLVLVARNKAGLQTLAQELRQAHGVEVTVLPADLASPETPARLFTELQQAGVTVDVLVNNAGFGAHGNFAALPLQRQLEMVQVNVTTLMHLTGLFLPGMIERRRGGVLNVASTAAFQPGPGMAIYFATKAFVLSFGEALAEELAGTGLVVTTLCPGPTKTNFGKVANFRGGDHLTRYGMSAEAVARYGHCAFRRGRVLAIPGFGNRLLTLVVRLTPRRLVRKIVKWGNAPRMAA
jgi:short-subunit dehydrogenase